MKAVVRISMGPGVLERPIAQQDKATPIGGLLDPRFKYVPAAETDIRKTFARILNERQKGKAL